MIPISQLKTSQLEESEALAELGREAEDFIESHKKWCLGVKAGFYDRGFSKVAVFFFEIIAKPPADSTVWVIMGDIPPGYMDTKSCPNGATALDGYVGAMRAWIDAVLAGKSAARLIPVLSRGSYAPVEPTRENAEALRGRMDFIDKNILPQWEDELDEGLS